VDRNEALKLSKDVQTLRLPSARPFIEGYAFFDYFQAAPSAEQIGGGDYYDYILLADGRLVVVVADVVGWGDVAARLLAKLYDEVRLCLALESDLAAAVTHLNKRVCQYYSDRVMTFVMVTLDPKTHKATIVNAGHSPPLHRHLVGSLNQPSMIEMGIPIGVFDDTQYNAAKLALQPGESLTLFTDGLFEAVNTAGEMFTFNRICEIVAATNGDPSEIGNSLLMQVRQHLGNQPQDDDMCLISFGPVPTEQVPLKKA
jgi:serine phosphatase RsbU (regulator of sigma subunit)